MVIHDSWAFMSDHAWLRIKGNEHSRMNLYASVWLHMSIHDHAWSNKTILNHAWSWLITFGGKIIVQHDCIWLCMIVHGYVWFIESYAWLSMISQSHTQLCITTRERQIIATRKHAWVWRCTVMHEQLTIHNALIIFKR